MAERAPIRRCAVYTRKSSEEGLEQSFNSLDAQREACLAYIESQRHEGWKAVRSHYDDGGYSGGTLERPALGELLADVEAGKVDVVVVYKVDRLTRSLADFAKIVEIFDAAGVSFVSVTQQFNTTSSMGRLTLNVLLSFAQFEREVTGERIRDKIAASKRKGMWMGGVVPLGYDLEDRKLVVNPKEAKQVRTIFRRYLELGCVTRLQADLKTRGIVSKRRTSKTGRRSGGQPYSRGALYDLLNSRIYLGEITHKGNSYPGQHEAIIEQALWDEVQEKLSTHRRDRRHGADAREPSLLAGILYDADGNRMTPSHTVRRGRRYRYYVSQALIRQAGPTTHRPGRVTAYDLEAAVLQRLQQLLASPKELLSMLDVDHDDAQTQRALVTQAKEFSDKLRELPAPRQREFLLATLWRVILVEEQIALDIDRGHLYATLLGRRISTRRLKGCRPQPDQVIRIAAAVHLRRRSSGVKLVMPPTDDGPMASGPSPTLIKSIAISHSAYEDLLNGEAKDLKTLARRYGMHERHLRRIMPMAFLPPKLVDNILNRDRSSICAFASQVSPPPSLWPQGECQLNTGVCCKPGSSQATQISHHRCLSSPPRNQALTTSYDKIAAP